MSGSITQSRTTSYTEARLRAVMIEIGGDFQNLVNANRLSQSTCDKWLADLTQILTLQAAHGFQLQFTAEGREPSALDYQVSADGSLTEVSKSGGIDFYALPDGTNVKLVIRMDWKSSRSASAKTYLEGRGWTFDAKALDAPAVQERVFSKDGYGVVRSRIGTI